MKNKYQKERKGVKKKEARNRDDLFLVEEKEMVSYNHTLRHRESVHPQKVLKRHLHRYYMH